MQHWSRIGIHQVNEFLDRDPEFLSLLEQQRDMEPEFLRVMETLTPQDRQIIDRYIQLCEELEYRRTITAYKCGRLNHT